MKHSKRKPKMPMRYRLPKRTIKKRETSKKVSIFNKGYNKFVIIGTFLALFAGVITNLKTIGKWFNKDIKPFFFNESPLIFKDTSKYNILLLPFDADGTCKQEKNLYHNQVHKRIHRLVKEKDLNIEILRLDTIKGNFIDPDTVRNYSKPLGADLTIYGNYQEVCEWDTTLINIAYVSSISTSDFSFGETGDLNTYKNSLLKDLREGRYTGDVEDIIYLFISIEEMNSQNWQNVVEIANYVNVSKLDEKKAVILHVIKGMAYFKLENFKDAIRSLKTALNIRESEDNLKDGFGEFGLIIGLAYANANNDRKAIEYLKKYKGANLNFAYGVLSSCYANIKDYTSSMLYVNRALELKEFQSFPEWQLYLQRGYLNDVMGDKNKAIKDVNKAIQSNPDDCEACREALSIIGITPIVLPSIEN